MPTKLEDTALSFEEWKLAGFYVIKGSKSKMRDVLGVPQFTADQVRRKGTFEMTHWADIQRRERITENNHRNRPKVQTKTIWERSVDRSRAKGTPWGVVEDFDSFVREAGMLPGNAGRVRFSINDPLERHFMDVADKHGVLDAILDGDWTEDDCW